MGITEKKMEITIMGYIGYVIGLFIPPFAATHQPPINGTTLTAALLSVVTVEFPATVVL